MAGETDSVSLVGAQQRVDAGDVTEVSWLTWDVAGDPERGDSVAWYLVTFNTNLQRYQCVCQRAMVDVGFDERLCEHVVAVVLFRGQYGDHRVGDGKQNSESQPDYVPPSDDADIYAIRHADTGVAGLSVVREPDDIEWGSPPYPQWVTQFRPHQWDAAVAVVEAFRQGSRVVFLDAPTGSGKTLIGEMVRRLMGTRGLYLCSDKQLQDQFARDFEYAKVLKGRSNYPTLDKVANGKGVTAADCDKHDGGDGVRVCSYCSRETHHCPYERAKAEALKSDLAVLNSTYFLTEVNNVGRFGARVNSRGEMVRRDLIIVDECDMLENELMRYIEFYIGEGTLRRLNINAPKKGSHHKTIADWLMGEFAEQCRTEAGKIDKNSGDIRQRRRRQTLIRMEDEAISTALELLEASELDEGVLWIRDNDAGPVSLKPVKVDRQANKHLWNYAEHWLCMSATIISGDVEAQSLGLNLEEIPWTVVKVPMTFPVENRPILAAPCADMSYTGRELGGWDDCVRAIQGVLRRHTEERVLIHTVSYKLAAYLKDNLRCGSRDLLTYANAGERVQVLEDFRKSSSGVLIAPSMERGVDLKDDDCRVVIVAKVPYPFVGDKAVGARMRQGREGDVWYAVQTIRSLIQMTGRAVRSETDYCTTYILDSQFLTNLYQKWSQLLPSWWKDAMQIINVRGLMKEGV